MQMSSTLQPVPARRAVADLASNAVSVVARMAAGVVLFVAVAHFLGPTEFGNFMFAMAVASLLAFCCGLGFNQQVLREIAAEPANGARIADALAGARAVLAALIFATMFVLALVFGGQWWVVLVLALALASDGAVEYLFALMKAHGHYGTEAVFIGVSSMLHFGGVAAVAYITQDLLWIASAFCLSRMLQLGAACLFVGRQIRLPRLNMDLRSQWCEMRMGWAYALDSGLSVAMSQLDTIVVRILLGSAAAGIYQAGMRVVIGVQNFSVVAGNVFIPRLARSRGDAAAWRNIASQSRRLYAAMALFGAAAVWIIGWVLMTYGYGASYSELERLWPLFAGLLGLRMVCANYGVRLTALGAQQFRTFVNGIALLMMLGLMLLATWLGLGLQGVIGALGCSAVFMNVAYRYRTREMELKL